jgi:hypothetical protein
MWVVKLVDSLALVVGEWGGEHLVLGRVYHLGFDLAADLLLLVGPALQ